jgi:hypothetical protein
LAGVVAQLGAFDEGCDVFLFIGGELVDGFELEPEIGAAELAAAGVESYRVELPSGADVNEVAVGAAPRRDAWAIPAESLVDGRTRQTGTTDAAVTVAGACCPSRC